MGQWEDPVNSVGIQKSLSQNTIKPRSRSTASFEDLYFMELKAKKTHCSFLMVISANVSHWLLWFNSNLVLSASIHLCTGVQMLFLLSLQLLFIIYFSLWFDSEKINLLYSLLYFRALSLSWVFQIWVKFYARIRLKSAQKVLSRVLFPPRLNVTIQQRKNFV